VAHVSELSPAMGVAQICRMVARFEFVGRKLIFVALLIQKGR
jgi:hypothetical protein